VEIGPLFFDIRESAVIQSPSCSLLSRVRMPTTLLPRLHILFMLFLWFSEIHPIPSLFFHLAHPVDHPLSVDVRWDAG